MPNILKPAYYRPAFGGEMPSTANIQQSHVWIISTCLKE